MAPVMDEIEASHSRHECRNCCQLSLSNISLPLKEANEVALRLRGKGVDASQGGGRGVWIETGWMSGLVLYSKADGWISRRACASVWKAMKPRLFRDPEQLCPAKLYVLYCNRQLELENCFVLPASEKAWHNWAQRGWVVF
jgi:hypothetical protein